MNYHDYLAADRRACILRLLVDVNGTANDSVIQTALDNLGHRNLSHDSVLADIRFLKDNGLVVDEWLGEIVIVTITKRGVDVSNGSVVVAGVKKPRIGV